MIPPLFAIFVYPLFALILFSVFKLRQALIWTLFLGYMFLPSRTSYNLPLLPAITKDSMPAIAVLICLALFGASAVKKENLSVGRGWIPRSPIIVLLLITIVAGIFGTAYTNGEALRYGPVVLPGLQLQDALSATLGMIMLLLPMLLARKYLADEDSQRLLLKSLAVAGIIYSLPIIYEVVMSPQLNRIVYGFFPHSWIQHVRNGGFRPLVFMQHGLWLGIFMCCTVLATAAYARAAEGIEKGPYLILGGWLLFILLISKTLGAFAIALLLIPVLFFLPSRAQILIAAGVVSCVLIYPTLRGADVIPVDRVVEIAEQINTNRAGSLQHRLNNEEQLLDRVDLKPVFGWGGWNRSRIFDEQGRDLTTADGQWIIRIGRSGWVGYLGMFGLLCGPIILFALRPRRYAITPVTVGLSIVLAANLIDLIPNSGMSVITWIMAGSLIGRLEQRAPVSSPEDQPVVEPEKPSLQYSRFAPQTQPHQGVSASVRAPIAHTPHQRRSRRAL